VAEGTKQNKAQHKQPRRSRATGFVLYNRDMKKKRVGIIRGGTGKHYASSLKKGGEIISHISENLSDKYKPLDILIDKKGNWYLNGVPLSPSDLIHKIDVVWNTAHSSNSVILDNLSIPNVGNSFFSSALENSKEMLQEHMKNIGVQMPKSVILPVYQKDFDGPRETRLPDGQGYAIKKAQEVFEKFPSPWIVKSFTPDSNMGIHLAKTFNELAGAIEDGVEHEKSILIEEFIAGKVASVHSVPHFRGQDIYTFPLGNSFGFFSADEKEKLTALAKDLHTHIGAKHYLKSDFVLSPRGRVYLLGIEITPDLDKDSHFSQVCESVGAKTHYVIEHILENV
jgi:D-alanine-D-alanine ligase-like ATP-grasp enzyme